MKAVVALAVALPAIGCGALIGIEDGMADPGSSGPDATTIIDGSPRVESGVTDASTTDTSMAAAPGPIGKPGGDVITLPCGSASCAIPGETCCAYRTTSSDPAVYTGVCEATCADPGPGTDRVASLKCSVSANCPNTAPKCCLPFGVSTVATSCKAFCDSQSEVQLCDPAVGCGSRNCRHFTGSTMPPSWGYCD